MTDAGEILWEYLENLLSSLILMLNKIVRVYLRD